MTIEISDYNTKTKVGKSTKHIAKFTGYIQNGIAATVTLEADDRSDLEDVISLLPQQQFDVEFKAV